MAGTGSVDLWLRSTAADTDLQVTLTEVRPDGRERYVQNGWLRASHRKLDAARSTELRPVHTHLEADAAPLPAGELVPVRVEIVPFGHVFRAGTRIRLSIEAPGGDRPLWTFKALQPTEPVTDSVAHTTGMPSRVVLPVVPGVELGGGLARPSLRAQRAGVPDTRRRHLRHGHGLGHHGHLRWMPAPAQPTGRSPATCHGGPGWRTRTAGRRTRRRCSTICRRARTASRSRPSTGVAVPTPARRPCGRSARRPPPPPRFGVRSPGLPASGPTARRQPAAARRSPPRAARLALGVALAGRPDDRPSGRPPLHSDPPRAEPCPVRSPAGPVPPGRGLSSRREQSRIWTVLRPALAEVVAVPHRSRPPGSRGPRGPGHQADRRPRRREG